MSYEMLRRLEVWLVMIAGLAWFGTGADEGLVRFLLAALPGSLLVTSAVANVVFPGDPYASRTGATGALIGIVFSVPLLLFAPLTALLLGGLSVIAALSLGRLVADDVETPEGLEPVIVDNRVAAEIALDESVLGLVASVMGMWNRDDQARVAGEIRAAREWLAAGGWDTDPAGYHEEPPPVGPFDSRTRRAAGLEVEVMRYDSEFEPRPGAPGRDRWLTYRGCRTSEVRLLRRSDSPDWLVCVHGLGMGHSPIDLRAFDASWLRSRGVNLAFPVLPLHGSRSRGRVSGAGFVTGEVLDTLHALTLTVWDIRRLVRWLRQEGARRVGIYGISMGGYASAVSVSLEDDLDCVIAGIPAVDLSELMMFHIGRRALKMAEAEGITREDVAAVLQPVAPLALSPKVPPERRFIYAGLVDRFVPPVQPRTLWEYWDQPEIAWYPGSHLGFRFHPQVRDLVDRGLSVSGLGRDG
ncbi:MAG: alpha/beta hydrolase family protein [Gammaproteobacteria bacterium]